ncbi:MAG: hypothetical protein EPN39_00190 [Chitinophagaceae bacterium]|nr:MAG: hypothetical protein EPN39_00190 [Chitinophagaceae bacterium]
MKHWRELRAEWDDYAIKQTLVRKGREEGREEEREKRNREFVKNFLSTGRFTISEIAAYTGISEAHVLKIKKELKK